MTTKKRFIFILLSFVLFALANLQIDPLGAELSKTQVHAFQRAFLLQEESLEAELNQLASHDLEQGFEKWLNQAPFSELNHSFFLLENDQLLQWSDELIAFDISQLRSGLSLQAMGNGWYLKKELQLGTKTLVGLALIQHRYTHQNQYLKNEFPPELDFSRILSIQKDSLPQSAIFDRAGQYLFSLQLESEKVYPKEGTYFQSILAVFALFLFFFTLRFVKLDQPYKAFLSLALLSVVRFLLLLYPPSPWLTLELFDPSIFAISSFIPSLGDFLLFGLILFYASLLVQGLQNTMNRKWIILPMGVFIAWMSIWVLDLIRLSVSNSTLSFNLNDLYDLNYLSLICFIGFALFLFALVNLTSCYWRASAVSAWKKSLVLLTACSLYFALSVFPELDSFAYFWILILFVIGLYIEKRQSPTLGVVALLLVVSAITSTELSKSMQDQEQQIREVYIQKLAEEKDLLAEYLFAGIYESIQKDSLVDKIAQSEPEFLDRYMRQNYFTGYWDKYAIAIIPCKTQDSLYTNPGSYRISCSDYYRERIHFEGTGTQSEHLHQLRNFAGRIDYIAVLSFGKGGEKVNVFIEMSASILNQNEGYPELLIDENVKPDLVDLSQYSYAVYDADDLIMKAGDFNYSNQNRVPELGESTVYKYQSENHEHFVYQKDAYTTIVLSKALIGRYAIFTSLAYLLVIFSLLYFLFSLLFAEFPLRFQFQFNDFSSRIQLFLIGSLLAALVLFSIGTGYYIKKQNQEKNLKNISEKLRSVNIEMENKIGGESALSDTLTAYVSTMLVKFSNVFYTDINLYDTSGILYASSRPEIYAKGLKGNRLNPKAFSGLIQNDKAEWLQSEKIGEMEYLSAYIPFRNDKNEVLAYLNLPYFAKHNELEEEISSFLVSTINIYVAIFVLALLVSILLINQLSKPLLMIRKQLGSIQLGGKLELIEWHSEDEIGSLVKEYNRMIVELSDSANRLAQSERESAWREMAKQVAHEIKNPLTPMKLSIQHLQLAYEQGAKGLDEKVKRTSQTLIEQIETLANIATEFSNFAKMPEQKMRELDLVAVLKSVSDLYAFPREGEFIVDTALGSAKILADQDQLIRLFNNLIKNSVQATKSGRSLRVSIHLSEEGKNYKVIVEDNGSGIPEHQLDRIFEPNFTTKTGGTGLGLAMCKNIMNNLGGRIEIKSELGLGTSFLLYFPKAKQ